MTVLAVSPHLDDAAFSAGGTLALAARAGHRVVVATVFTQSVPNAAGFALACQTDKGIPPEIDYLALRRAEDAAACAVLGTEPVWLDLPEAPHRGYESPAALFAGVRPDDAGTWRAVLGRLQALARTDPPDLVLTCQGLGGHADHRHTVRAVVALTGACPVAWWRDVPYALREPDAAPDAHVPTGLVEVAAGLDAAAVEAKVAACAAYASQLGYQFGRDAAAGAAPAAVLRARLVAFGRREAARLGASGAAEVFATAAPDVLSAAVHAAGQNATRPAQGVRGASAEREGFEPSVPF